MASDKLADRKPNSELKPNVLGIFVVFVIVAVAGGTVVYSLSDWTAPDKARQMQNPFPPTPKAIGLGMSTYTDRCQNCHGEDGNGKGERAEKLSVAPSDFTDAHAMGLLTDGELFWKISEGHRPMPGFKGKLTKKNAGKSWITFARFRSHSWIHPRNPQRPRATKTLRLNKSAAPAAAARSAATCEPTSHFASASRNFLQIRHRGNIVILEPRHFSRSDPQSRWRVR